MSTQQSLSDRVAKLRQLKNADGAGSFPSAEFLPGDWPQHCKAFPASYAQSRLWFLHQLQPDLTAYHLPALWRLSGNLDLKALRLALADLIERHPTLRTSFCLQGSEVVQLIHPPAPFPLDADPLADRNPDAVIEQWLEQERTTPFDLSAGLLLRARLLAVDHQHHLLLLNHHHIASDGWSRSVLARDLTALYNARRSGQASELAPLQVQYHDYAAWQRQRLSGDRLQALKDYWIPQLTGLEPLELPSDHPRPATPSHRGASVAFQITPELLAPFEELCRLEGATLQMGLLALVALLLHRYSRQEDFAIGVPIWGRNHPDLEPLIGFFINTLPVRTLFTPGQSFRELLQQVKASSLAAYDNQELPFEQMVEALNLPRDTSRNPLVQVMLQLMELSEASLINLEGLVVDAIPSKSESSKLDLSFYLRRSADHGLHGSIAYATDLFSSDRMERFCSHLLTLLSSALEAPDSPEASLCLLPDAERQLIESWQNGPTIDVPDLCVHQLFEQQVERTPDAIALIFEDQQLTYREFNARANRLAHHFIGQGVRPDDRVALLMERSPALVVAILAILKAGAAYVPLHNEQPSARHIQIMADAGVRLLLIDETAKSIAAEPLLVLSLEAIEAEGLPEHDPGLPVFSQQLAYVMFTSGSTGVPKGVAVTHSNIVNLTADSCWQNGMHERVLFHSPHAFDASTYELWVPLLHGGQVVVAPPVRLEVSSLVDLIERHSVSGIFLTTALFNLLAEVQPTCFGSVDEVWTGGEAVSPLAMERVRIASPRAQIVHVYGPTETTTFATFHPLPSTKRLEGTVPIGKPMEGMRAYVLDAGLQPTPVGVPGELYLAGTGLAQGYVGLSGLTSECFVADPFEDLFADGGARMYRTGDQARWLADGNLEFLGRADFQVKIRGFRIELGEIETALRACEGIQEAVVLSHEDGSGEKCLVAYVTVAGTTGEATLPAVLEAQLRSSLPDYMVPAAFLQLEALPLTPNGKLDRKALPAPSFSGNLEQRVAPSADLERQLHAIWAEVLGHEEFGITDNFFAVGGHSLAAASLVSRAEKAIGISISLAKLFQSPTIFGLVDQLGKEKGEPQQDDLCCLIPLQPLGSRPPLVIVPGFGGVLFFDEGARFLAPHQPVYGLRVIGDPASMRRQSFETIISTFADLIVDFWQQGDINLMGYSVGGWYAHALAAELLRRGRRIGALVIIDTVPNIRINRSLGARLLLDRLSQVRLRMHMRNLVREPTLEKRKTFIWDKMRTLKQAIEAYIGLRIPRPGVSLAKAMPAKTRPQTDFFVDLVRNSYRAAPLPITVAFLATPLTAQRYKRLWRHCTTRDLQTVVFYGEHLDVLRPDFQPKLALLIDNFLIGQQDGSC